MSDDNKILWLHWLWMAPVILINWAAYALVFVLQWVLVIAMTIICLPVILVSRLRQQPPVASPSPPPSRADTP